MNGLFVVSILRLIEAERGGNTYRPIFAVKSITTICITFLLCIMMELECGKRNVVTFPGTIYNVIKLSSIRPNQL